MPTRVQTLSRNNRIKYLKKYVWYKHPGFRCYPQDMKSSLVKGYGKVVGLKTTKKGILKKTKARAKKGKKVRFV